MAEKTLATISTELVIIDQRLDQLRKTYLKQREATIDPLRRSYEKARNQYLKKKEELKSLLSNNIVDCIMNPTVPQKPVDDQIFGYSSANKE